MPGGPLGCSSEPVASVSPPAPLVFQVLPQASAFVGCSSLPGRGRSHPGLVPHCARQWVLVGVDRGAKPGRDSEGRAGESPDILGARRMKLFRGRDF